MAAKRKTLADFSAIHDNSVIIPKRYREGIAKLGVDGWEYEFEFMRANGIASQFVNKYGAPFEAYKVKVRVKRDYKNIICGSIKLAKKMREALNSDDENG